MIITTLSSYLNNQNQEQSLQEINTLLHQLSEKAISIDLNQLRTVSESTNSTVYIIVKEEHIKGMGTLAIYDTINNIKGYIEDIVVDQDLRGKGYGKAITQHIIAEAKKLKIKNISLTSRPQREVANKLYQSLGFELYNTNYYKLNLE